MRSGIIMGLARMDGSEQIKNLPLLLCLLLLLLKHHHHELHLELHLGAPGGS